MDDVVIVAALRTAVGKFGGTIAKIPATELGAKVIAALLQKTGIKPDIVSEVIMGQVLTAGVGQNPARQASIRSGLPDMVPAMTINKVCGSGLKATHLAAQAIKAGDADIVIAGGQESMSLAPHVLNAARDGLRMMDGKLVDTMIVDGLWDVYNQYHMGTRRRTWRRNAALRARNRTNSRPPRNRKRRPRKNPDVSRTRSCRSRSRPQRRRSFSTATNIVRHGTTVESLAGLKPAFDKSGTVTAGNASGLNDGAAAVVMMIGSRKAKELGLKPLARIKAYSSAGVDPSIMGIGPIPASKLCLKKAGWTPKDLDLLEINEAFAAQAIAVNRDMGWDTSKVNVNGGAIAIGHPIGASGCRILVTLLHEMIQRDAKKGLASLCIGGGMGVALAIER